MRDAMSFPATRNQILRDIRTLTNIEKVTIYAMFYNVRIACKNLKLYAIGNIGIGEWISIARGFVIKEAEMKRRKITSHCIHIDQYHPIELDADGQENIDLHTRWFFCTRETGWQNIMNMRRPTAEGAPARGARFAVREFCNIYNFKTYLQFYEIFTILQNIYNFQNCSYRVYRVNRNDDAIERDLPSHYMVVRTTHAIAAGSEVILAW